MWDAYNDGKEHGQEVIFFKGTMEVKNQRTGELQEMWGVHQVNEDGSVQYFIRCDLQNRTAGQTYRHETFHDFVKNNPKLWKQITNYLRKNYSYAEVARICEAYFDAYDGIYGSQQGVGIRYVEEAFADVFANILGRADTRPVLETLNKYRDQIEAARKNAQTSEATRETRGSPEQRYSSGETGPMSYDGVDLSKDGRVYDYDFLIAQPAMHEVILPDVPEVRNENGDIDRAVVVRKGIQNARSVGTERDGSVFIENRYTNRKLRVDVDSIRHGLNGNLNRLLTNARVGSVIGDVIQNAIPINALHNTAQNVEGTYAMAAYTTDSLGREIVAIVTVEQRSENVIDLETYDVAHAVSGRQKRVARRARSSREFTLSRLPTSV
jgi:hypothetical protein